MASQIDICNMALANIGQSQFIADINEQSLAAQQCQLWYPTVLDQVLREGAWSFAIVYAALGLVTTNPTTDYTYAYRMPSDCLNPLRILTGQRVEASPNVYRVARDSAGSLILTDKASAILQYVQRVADPSVYTPDFVEALALKLGYALAMPMSVKAERRDQLGREYRAALTRARASDANSAVQDPEATTEFIGIRNLAWPNVVTTSLTPVA